MGLRLPLRVLARLCNRVAVAHLSSPQFGKNGTVMAGGWTRDGATQEQIDDTVTDGVKRARARLTAGAGETHCTRCGEEIPEARRRAMPGARTCASCQAALDGRPAFSPFNRRGSKDSQLR
jgi:phage/conjugal plasmid C-4 type zinc finger TraR family protein